MLPAKQSPWRGCGGHLSVGKLSAALLILIALSALLILWLNRRPPAENAKATADTNVPGIQSQPVPLEETRNASPVTTTPLPQPSSNAAAVKTPGNTQQEIRIAMLYNFVKFIDWHSTAFPNAAAPFVLGVFGPNPFADAADQSLADRKVNGRSIVVKRLGPAKNSSPAEWKSCHL